MGNAQPHLRPHIRKVLAGVAKVASKPLQMADALVAINNALPEGHRVGVMVERRGSSIYAGFAHADGGSEKTPLYWKHASEAVQAKLLRDPGVPFPYGHIVFSRDTGSGPCAGAYVVSSVSRTPVGSGWGVLLYELAIEIATKLSGGAGLTPDRSSVSDLARRVWEKYDAGGRVEKRQLDDLRNTLSPDDGDNCLQESAMEDPVARGRGRTVVVDGKEVEAPWTLSSLSRAYSKKTQDTVAALD
jgi:hypothetical protein